MREDRGFIPELLTVGCEVRGERRERRERREKREKRDDSVVTSWTLGQGAMDGHLE
jgi:hypothetical protein